MSAQRDLFRLSSVVIASLGFGVCAAGPAPSGTEVGVSAGAGHRVYTASSCGGQVTRTEHAELNAHTYASHRFENGFSVEGEAGVLHDRTHEDETLVGGFAPRFGYHGAYGGGSVGPAVLLGVEDLAVIPSVSLWAGQPDVLFVWADTGTGPMSLAALPLGAGVGGSRPEVRWRLGTYASAVDSRELSLAVHADAQFRVASAWIGAGTDVHDADTWKGQLFLAFDLAKPAAE